MKKLMIAAAIVCAAAVSQAASVYWTCTNVKESGTAVSGVAYWMTTEFLADATTLEGKGATAVKAALDGYYSFNGTSGAFGVAQENAVDQSLLKVTGGKAYDAYLIVFDTAEITDSSKFYVTATKAFAAQEGASDVGSVKWASQSTASAAAGAWHAVAAPEPTSGLLLLLGVAGLALRRRRA